MDDGATKYGRETTTDCPDLLISPTPHGCFQEAVASQSAITGTIDTSLVYAQGMRQTETSVRIAARVLLA